MDLMLLSSDATKLLKELQYLKQRILIIHKLSKHSQTATPGLFY